MIHSHVSNHNSESFRCNICLSQVKQLNLALRTKESFSNDCHALIANFVRFKQKLLQTLTLAQELFYHVGRLQFVPLLLLFYIDAFFEVGKTWEAAVSHVSCRKSLLHLFLESDLPDSATSDLIRCKVKTD